MDTFDKMPTRDEQPLCSLPLPLSAQPADDSGVGPAGRPRRTDTLDYITIDVRDKELGEVLAGIGRQVDHRVQRVAFEAEPGPAAVMEIRYEYHATLVRLGVLPRPFESPLDRREKARGFAELEFAPDPYR